MRFLAVVGPWSVLLAIVSAYAILSSSESVLSVRVLGQAFLPFALLSGLGFEAAAKRLPAGVTRGVFVASMLVMVTLMASPFFVAPFGQGSYGGSQLAYSPSDLASMGWLRSYGNATVLGDYRYSYLAGYYNVSFGNLLSLEGVEGGGLRGTFLLSQAYYYRGYFPGGLANLRFPPVADTVLPEQDLSYANGRIWLYSFAG